MVFVAVNGRFINTISIKIIPHTLADVKIIHAARPSPANAILQGSGRGRVESSCLPAVKIL